MTIEDFREKARTVKIDWGLLQGFDRAISEVAQRLELEPTNRVDFLLSLPGVLEPVAVDEEDAELLQSLVEAAAQEAVEALVEMRKAEGARLAAALLEHLAFLEKGLKEVKALAELLPQEALARLETRIAELAGICQ